MNSLSDVTISSVANNQILQYDSASGQWINVTNVTLTGAATGNVISLQRTAHPASTPSNSMIYLQQLDSADGNDMVTLINSGVGTPLYIGQDGVLQTGSTNALRVYTNAAQVNALLVDFVNDNASTTQGIFRVWNHGTGDVATLRNYRAGGADGAEAGNVLYVFQGATSLAGKHALHVYTNWAQTNSSLVRFENDKTSSNQPVLEIVNTGTGTDISAPNFTLTNGALVATSLALGAGSITMSGSIGVTGTRVTKGWFTDLESTNMPTVGGTSLSSTFAVTALSNLASVAINTSLISDTDSTDDLGSTTVAWANLYVDTIKSITGNALNITPIAGSNLNINLSTTGDLAVNTNQLYVDTSAGKVGIGTTEPGAMLDVANRIRVGAGSSYGIQFGTGSEVIYKSANDLYLSSGAKIYIDGTSVILETNTSGNVGIGITAPTAVLHLQAGTATANTAPLKFNSGILLTTAEAGAMEFVTDTLSFTITTGAARKTIAFTDSAITSSMYIGTTQVALNRASAALVLTGITSIDGNAATVTTNATLTGVITSVGNTTSIASQTGTGTKFVVDTSPVLVTPTIASLIGNKIYPASDSTTAIQINKADTTTNVLDIDTTNARVGVNNTPNKRFVVVDTAGSYFGVGDTSVGYGSLTMNGYVSGFAHSGVSDAAFVISNDGGNSYLNLKGGYFGIGTASPLGPFHSVVANGYNVGYFDTYSATSATDSEFAFRKSHQNTVGNTATVDTESLGILGFWGNSGSAFTQGAFIQALQVGSASTSTPTQLVIKTADGTNPAATRLTIDNLGNLVPGTAALATGATSGFLYIPTCAGTPTGTPTAFTGRLPLVYDSTNDYLYIYNGAWKKIPKVQSSVYTITNVTTDRAYDANSTTVDELADVLGTLIADLQSSGLVG